MPAKKRQSVQVTVQHDDQLSAWRWWHALMLHKLSSLRSLLGDENAPGVVCWAGAYERGSHDHSHVWLYFTRPLSARDVKSTLGLVSGFENCHIALCDGTIDDNLGYLDGRKKQEERGKMLAEWFDAGPDNPVPQWAPNAFWYQVGPIPCDDQTGSKRGRRVDLEEVYTNLKTGMLWSDLEDAYPTAFVMYQRSLSQMYSRHLQKREHEALIKTFKDATLREWQETALSILDSQSPRQIAWFWDSKGNSGKTWMCRYLSALHGYVYLESGPRRDLAHALSVAVEDSTVAGICVDLTRSFASSDADLVSRLSPITSLAEACKNGVVYSGKYNSKVLYLSNCKVFIVANFAPDYETRAKLLSLDRWNVNEIITL